MDVLRWASPNWDLKQSHSEQATERGRWSGAAANSGSEGRVLRLLAVRQPAHFGQVETVLQTRKVLLEAGHVVLVDCADAESDLECQETAEAEEKAG